MERLRKILLLTKNYPPQIGGIEAYAHNLYNNLLDEGYDVQIIKALPRNEYFFSKSSQFFLCKIIYILLEISRLLFFLFQSLTKGIYLSRNSHIIWSIDGSISGLGYLLTKTSRLFKGKNPQTCISRVTLHGTDVVWPNQLYQLILPWFWSHTDEIIAVSDLIKKEAVKRGVTKAITICGHSSQSLFFSEPGLFNRSDFLRAYNIPTDKILLFSIGRFIELKGFHWFLSEVMPALNDRFYYILGGFGPLESEYRRIIKEKSLVNVSLIGSIRDSVEKARWFSSANYFIMPNILTGGVEGFGIVLLEAHYYGTRCIISDANGIATRKRQADIVLPAQDSKEWIKVMEKEVKT